MYSGMDVDAMDLEKYPAWRNVEWYDVQMETGDCLFIPTAWYHTVFSEGGRNLAVNTWWWRSDTLETTGTPPFDCPLEREALSLADCTFGYDMYSNDWTHCLPGRKDTDPKPKDGEVEEPKSKIINWIEADVETLKKMAAKKKKKKKRAAEIAKAEL